MSLNASEILLEIRAIEQLKYRYIRAVDSHDWDLFRQCLAEDVHVWLANGAYKLDGREAMADWLRGLMDEFVYTAHTVTQPEIELTGPTTATGIWRVQEIDYYLRANPGIKIANIPDNTRYEAASYYYDEYAKIDGAWLIQSTGYVAMFNAAWRTDRTDDQKLTVDPMRGVRPARD